VNRPAPNNAAIEERLKELLNPAVLGQWWYGRLLGLRDRILTLPVMVSLVLTVLWRQVPSVCELARMLAREEVLWSPPLKVSQQALSKRLLTFPYELFQRILQSLVPTLKSRWETRERPLPASVVQARQHFSRLLSVDGSTLEALFRKLDSLQEVAPGTLAGKIGTVIDLASRLPEQVGFKAYAQAHDTGFQPDIVRFARALDLWVFDRGFYDFTFFGQLIAKGAALITRAKSNLAFEVAMVLISTDRLRERLITVADCPYRLRFIEVRVGTTWYRYLTSVIDPTVLPAPSVMDLYRRRWRIEEAFFIVKRLVHLSYLWTGSVNGVLLQVWSSWLFYAVLIDLGDAVAEELNLPFDRISVERVFRGLYHFSRAYARGEAEDAVKYLAASDNQDLGVVKRIRRKPPAKAPPQHDSQDLTSAVWA
jgi:Transposase DDE domain